MRVASRSPSPRVGTRAEMKNMSEEVEQLKNSHLCLILLALDKFVLLADSVLLYFCESLLLDLSRCEHLCLTVRGRNVILFCDLNVQLLLHVPCFELCLKLWKYQ